MVAESKPRSLLQSAEVPLSILSYSTCSISMIILNKLVTATYNYNHPLPLVFFQNLSAVIVVVALRWFRIVDYPNLEFAIARRWIPLTFLFVGMLATSLLSLKTMSVPMQTLIKNMAIVMTAVGDHHFFGHPLDRLMMFSFLLMIAGSSIGIITDRWVTPEGLFWTSLNAVCTSSYQLYMKGVLNDLRQTMGRWGPVYYNNLLSLPLLLPTIVFMPGWSEDLLVASDAAKVCIGFMMAVSALMTMTSFWCMTATSPTSYGVIGGMNKIPLALLGMAIFNQYPTSLGGFGITIALMGGLLYTHAVNQAKDRELALSPLTAPGGRLPEQRSMASLSDKVPDYLREDGKVADKV